MRRLFALALASFMIVGCSNADASTDRTEAVAEQPQAVVGQQALPTVLVYKTPTCGCCNGWVEHLQEAGFTVDARNIRDIMTVKHEGGVPANMSSCHTAIIDGYVVEGHVPADQVRRLLAERPEVAGIAVPGMPIGSPGMEGPNAKPYEVFTFAHDGTLGVFAEVDPR